MRIRGKILTAILLSAMIAAIPAHAYGQGTGTSGTEQSAEPAGADQGAENTEAAQAAEPDPGTALRVMPIDFGDDGWGDGTLIESAGEYMLMDTFMPECQEELMDFLVDNGYTEFSIYLSHYHADHFCNIRPIMWDDRFKVTAVYLPDDDYLWPTDEDYGAEIGWFMSIDRGIRELAEEQNIPMTELHPGDSFRIGDALVEILYGASYENDDHDPSYINNNSLVARITGGGIRYLTCGDIEALIEEDILDKGIDVSADLFKLSHHGGGTSNTYSFLEAVNPSFAFFNSIADSPDDFAYDWAAKPVSDMMEFANVYSSRYNGNMTFTARDGVITVRAERNTVPQIMTYKAPGGIGLCMTFQQFNDQQEPKETEKMRAAAEAAAEKHGLLPAVYR